MERKKILIPNGNPSELQLINAAHRLGLYVITSGNNKNAPAHPFADRYISADFSDKEAMLSLAKEQKIDYICSNSNDIALTSVAYVCQELGLPGHDPYEITLKLHHKDSFRKLAKKLSLHVPRGESFSSRESALQYAASQNDVLIVKPVDLVGGNGISAASTLEEKICAINKAFRDSLSGRIVIEEYIDGSAHSLSTFLVDQKVVSYFCDNEYTLGKPYKISTSASPATGFEKVQNLLIQDIEAVARELNLVDGRLHLQYLMKDDTPYILEMSRRISGDLYSVPESFSLGFNTADWYLRAECGLDVSSIPRRRQQGMYGRHCIVSSHEGITDGIQLASCLEDCVMLKWLWSAYGHRVTCCENDILGLLFFHFETEEQMQSIITQINHLITVNIIE